MIEFTETVYKNKKTDELCRIVDEVYMNIDNGLERAMVIVGIDGIKIAIPEEEFNREYSEYAPGEKIVQEK